jgi:hypothetical protein
MFCQAAFDPWQSTIMPPLSPLRKPQATVLALWSVGMVLARSGALTAVRPWWAQGLKRTEPTVRPQLREWSDDVPRQRGPKRHAWQGETGVPVVLAWVVRGWQGTPRALALEATALGTRCGGLAVRVVSRGCAIPVAWGVRPAHPTQAWRREWRRRRRRRRPAIPRHWQGIGLAARGVEAPWRLRRSGKRGWHPCWRLKTGGTCRPAGPRGGRPWQRWVPQPGTRGRGRGTALQPARRPREWTRWAVWAEGSKAPWLLLTELPPEAREAAWDGRRAGSAPGLTSTQRAGWPWHRTRRRAPERAAWRWLAVAVATWWWHRGGGAADETSPASPWLDVTALCPGRPRTRRATRLRRVRVLRQGWSTRRVAVLRQEPVPQGRLVPEPWPAVPAWEEEAHKPPLALPEAA